MNTSGSRTAVRALFAGPRIICFDKEIAAPRFGARSGGRGAAA